jgi:diguanylate cyclase
MSSARSKTDPGEIIVQELRAARLPLGPRQFEFWFACKNGVNPALNSAANEIRVRTGALTGPDIDWLHEAYLSPWRATGQPDSVAARLHEKLRDIATTLEGAIGATQAQSEMLSTEATQLGDASTIEYALRAIYRLSLATKESQTRLAQLENRMDAATREIGEIQQQLSAVRAECQADPTTALPPRATFNAILAQTLEDAAETRQPVSVALCDLDYFAAFNEHFGIHKGDQVLRAIATLAKAQMRLGDTITRYSGDEFAIVLPQLRAGDAVAYADRLRQTLAAHTFAEHPNGAGRVTVSIGIADAIKGDTPEFLLRRAANGLKVAKREGRNRVVEMSPDGPIWDAKRRM